MTPEIEKPAEGFWQPCPECKGIGKVTITEGILKTTTRETECELCKGAKQIFFVLDCSRMSTQQFESSGGNTHYGPGKFLPTPCMGTLCHLWDHEHKGGCLERKLMLKELYAGL